MAKPVIAAMVITAAAGGAAMMANKNNDANTHTASQIVKPIGVSGAEGVAAAKSPFTAAP
jgi:hypothetical protein